MKWSLFLCLGSTLSALFGLLVMMWGARRERWRPLWVLVAAVFLIGAAFGTAETVYQLVAEREERSLADGGVPTAPPSRPTLRPTLAPTSRPTVTPTPRPLPSPTATATPPPLPTTPPDDAGVMASALIPAERDALAALENAPRYVLNVNVDFDALTVSGTADVLYTNNETTALEALFFRLYPNARHYEEGETRIDAVNVDAVSVDWRFEDDKGTILRVPLPAPLAPGTQTRVQIAFQVTVPRRSDRFGYDQGVMSLGHWYPMLAVYDDEGWNLDPYVALGDAFYSDVAFFTVHVTAPEDVVIAATGVQVGRVLHRPPRATVVYASGPTRDFALALSRDYETTSTQVGDTTVTAYYWPGHEEGGQQALQVAADALTVYNARFGPYPYTELDVAETAFTVLGSPGGMEFPGVVFISSEFYRPDSLFAADMAVVVAHEVAHQWWYGVVGNNQVDEPWLDESFATYASILYAQETQDPLVAEAVFWSQAVLPYQLVQMLGDDGPVQSSLLDYEGDLITYQALVYSKGALFLARLREQLGDEMFFALLSRHYQMHKYGLLAADDFRRSLASLGDADALALYDAVVVRGEPLELEGLEGLDGLFGDEFSPEQLDELLQRLEEMMEGLEP